MGLHERAWAGLGLMVYGKTPTVPMQVEQALATATPNNEVKIDSFEDYGDALDFCKTKRNIGFIFLLEDCGELPAHDVFTQLARPYETKGLPTFGILIHAGPETFAGLRAVQRCPNLLGYVSLEDILNKDKAAHLMSSIWTKFNAAFEKTILPQPLQETFLALARDRLTSQSIHFIDRVSALLSSNLNISWLESVSLRWSPVITAISESHPAALEPHTGLVQICDLSSYAGLSSDVAEIITSKQSLCARIAAISTFLDKKRVAGELAETLQKLGTISKPGAPALLRHTVSARDRIISIAREEENNLKVEKTG